MKLQASLGKISKDTQHVDPSRPEITTNITSLLDTLLGLVYDAHASHSLIHLSLLFIKLITLIFHTAPGTTLYYLHGINGAHGSHQRGQVGGGGGAAAAGRGRCVQAGQRGAVQQTHPRAAGRQETALVPAR